jgi:hypothetical protein
MFRALLFAEIIALRVIIQSFLDEVAEADFLDADSAVSGVVEEEEEFIVIIPGLQVLEENNRVPHDGDQAIQMPMNSRVEKAFKLLHHLNRHLCNGIQAL